MSNCSENVLNLRDFRRFPYPWFNSFGHKGEASTRPVTQLQVMDYVQDHTSDLSCIARNLLIKIVRETCRRGIYYTFMSNERFAKDIKCGVRSIERAIKELKEAGWIATQRSRDKPYNMITDFNVDMALGTKGKDTAEKSRNKATRQNGGNKEDNGVSTRQSGGYNKSNKDSLLHKESSDRKSVTESARKEKKLTRSDLYKTWGNAYNEYPDTEVRCYLSPKQKRQLSSILKRWKGSAEDLHSFVEWSVLHWEYVKYRMKSDNMPKLPHVGWFIACYATIYEFWVDNISENNKFDEKIVELRQAPKPEVDTKRKYAFLSRRNSKWWD